MPKIVTKFLRQFRFDTTKTAFSTNLRKLVLHILHSLANACQDARILEQFLHFYRNNSRKVVTENTFMRFRWSWRNTTRRSTCRRSTNPSFSFPRSWPCHSSSRSSGKCCYGMQTEWQQVRKLFMCFTAFLFAFLAFTSLVVSENPLQIMHLQVEVHCMFGLFWQILPFATRRAESKYWKCEQCSIEFLWRKSGETPQEISKAICHVVHLLTKQSESDGSDLPASPSLFKLGHDDAYSDNDIRTSVF